MSILPPTTQPLFENMNHFSFDNMDPYKLILGLVQTLDQLLPADQNVPRSGSLEDYTTLLSTLRSTRDSISERISVINHEFHSAQGLARIYELRIIHATNTLNAFEDVIGEVRARFRARGIPIYPPHDRRINATHDAAPSGPSPETVMAIESGTAKEDTNAA